jgi:hypothetical protein
MDAHTSQNDRAPADHARPNRSQLPADCAGGAIVRFVTPEAWTMAPLTFQYSADGLAFYDLFHVVASTGPVPPFSLFEVMLSNLPPNAVLSMPPGTGGTIAHILKSDGNDGRHA